MEPEGILKGSNKNERKTNTAKITGNRPAVQSNHQGCCSRACRVAALVSVSTWVMP